MSLNLSLKYSLEEGLQLSFSIVSVSIHASVRSTERDLEI